MAMLIKGEDDGALIAVREWASAIGFTVNIL